MHELERRLGAKDVHPRESCGRVRDCVLVEARQLCRLARVDVVAQDRDGVRERPRLRREPRQAQRNRARAGTGLDLVETGHVLLGRCQALGGDRVDELTQEQRIASRRFLAGGAEGIVSLGREALAQEPGDRLGAQGSGLDGCGERIGDDLPDEARILSRFRRPEADEDQEIESLHPWQEVGQPA